MIQNHHNAAFWADGHATQVVEFDHDAIDAGNGQKATDANADAAVALAKILVWAWSGRFNVKFALVRFVALTAGLRPDLLRNRPLREIAGDLGVVEARLCRMVGYAQKEFGVKFSRTWSEERRKRWSEQRKGHPKSNHGKKGKPVK